MTNLVVLKAVNGVGTSQLSVLKDVPAEIGRIAALGITSKRVSRQHCRVAWHGDTFLVVEAVKNVEIQRHTTGVYEAIAAGSFGKLYPGDTLYLVRGEEPVALRLPLKRSADGPQTDSDVSPLLKRPRSGPLDNDERSTSLGSEQQSQSSLAAGTPGLFDAVAAVFWVRERIGTLCKLFRQCGGEVHDAATASTTHIICPADISAETALERLAGGGADAPGSVETLLQRYHFVTREWISRSLAVGQLQPESLYQAVSLVHGPAAAAHADRANAGAARTEDTAPERAAEAQPADAPDAAAGAADRSVGARAGNAASPDVALLEARFPGSTVTEVRDGVVVLVAWRPQGWHPGLWGVDSIWLEPFDEGSAKETMRKVHQHWRRLQVLEDGKTRWGDSFESQCITATGIRGPDSAEGGAKCTHPCCQALPTCLIAELEAVQSHYYKGETTTWFRKQAASNGINVLSQLQYALSSPDDVDALPALGAKTREKLREIIETGALARNTYQQRDERHSAMQLFLSVWGVGPTVARRWLDAGYTTLRDAMQWPSLTSQQKTGLQHYDDLQKRIPREEVEAGAAVVRAHVLSALQTFTGSAPADLEHRLHARPMGSFVRGKPMTGDIDVLVIPPDSAGRICSRRLLLTVLASLRAAGFVAEDFQPHGDDCECLAHSATYMGICYVPGFPRVARRFDFKVYPAEQRVTAVNYFTGSSVFCRCLRYWSIQPPAEVMRGARSLMPEAIGFKLSDKCLRVRSHAPLDDDESGRLPLHCETDIFKALQLDYVPPYMRFYLDFE